MPISSIRSYLNSNNSELLKFYEKCGLDEILESKSGITFILPIGQDYYNKVDLKRLKDILLSYVFLQYLPSVESWPKKLTNANGIEVETRTIFSKKGIAIKNNNLMLDSKDDKSKIAIWEGSGFMPVAEQKKKEKPKKKKGGGEKTVSFREGLASVVESEYCYLENDSKSNPYLERSVSILNYLQQNNMDVFKAILPILDRNPIITFYILISPASSHHILSDEILNKWNGSKIFTNASEEYNKILDSVFTIHSCGFVQNQDLIQKQIEKLRQDILNEHDCSTLIEEIYKDLVEKNCIGTVCDVFPEETIALFKNHLHKLWLDEMRFMLHYTLHRVRMPIFREDIFKEFIRATRYDYPGTNFSNEIRFINFSKYGLFSASAAIELMTEFVKSDIFCCVPLSPTTVSYAKNKTENEKRQFIDSLKVNTE